MRGRTSEQGQDVAPWGPWGSRGGSSVFLHQPRRTGSHFLSHIAPSHHTSLSPGNFPPPPLQDADWRVHIACPPLRPCRLHVRTRAHQHRQHHALGNGSFMLPLKGITLHLQKTAPIPTLLSQYPTPSRSLWKSLPVILLVSPPRE